MNYRNTENLLRQKCRHFDLIMKNKVIQKTPNILNTVTGYRTYRSLFTSYVQLKERRKTRGQRSRHLDDIIEMSVHRMTSTEHGRVPSIDNLKSLNRSEKVFLI